MNQSKKSLLFYAWSFIAICFIVSITFTSCNKNEDVAPVETQNPTSENQEFKSFTVKEITKLTSSNPLLVSLKKTSDIMNLNSAMGTPDWNNASLSTYDNTDLSAILVPMSLSRTLIAYTKPGAKEFKVMILEITSNEKSNNEFSGEMNLYLTSGDLLHGGVFENDKLVKSNEMSEATMRANVNWSCFKRCFHDTFDRLPWYIRYGCGAVAGACFGGVLPSCAALAGCVGGYAAGCLWVCR
jgi:hypothetical protein